MTTTWKVIDSNTEKVVEGDFKTSKAAMRALMIFSAHEVKNGRVANYRVEPPITISYTIPELNLPDWALQALEVSPDGERPA